MTHIKGHIPQGTLFITDKLDKNGGIIKNPTPVRCHGYLYPAINGSDNKPDTALKILIQNNNKIQLPDTTKTKWEDRRVGFHLKWIDLPQPNKNGMTKIGIAYDLIDWVDHKMAEDSLGEIPRFNGMEIENIDPAILDDVAFRLENLISKNSTAASDPECSKLMKIYNGHTPSTLFYNKQDLTGSQVAVMVLRQSAAYIRSGYFAAKKHAEGEKAQYTWIKKNIIPFDLADGFFGNY